MIRDTKGGVFGALVPERLKTSEREKYYGNGTVGVWSFVSGTIKVSSDLWGVAAVHTHDHQFFSWSFKNSYFLLSSQESIALGGGGHFAIYLVR